ncbi:hypothetical protein [Siphonobacter sp. SORGH_AS_0500]|uniref:hypothetical protein n=1 Tax=Siphonobacter sp. SORGH_AS_0500 TaxID=1864824 RepID=UPI00285AB028|nr:hypothetical protein [Siphonobacter sp. SORGH_AS_0500]MDR6195662.1 hypothetical protein [Siphonobacter sp. SORGH_AS_0500]
MNRFFRILLVIIVWIPIAVFYSLFVIVEMFFKLIINAVISTIALFRVMFPKKSNTENVNHGNPKEEYMEAQE